MLQTVVTPSQMLQHIVRLMRTLRVAAALVEEQGVDVALERTGRVLRCPVPDDVDAIECELEEREVVVHPIGRRQPSAIARRLHEDERAGIVVMVRDATSTPADRAEFRGLAGVTNQTISNWRSRRARINSSISLEAIARGLEYDDLDDMLRDARQLARAGRRAA